MSSSCIAWNELGMLKYQYAILNIDLCNKLKNFVFSLTDDEREITLTDYFL